MKKFLANAKMKTKIIIPLILIAMIGLAGAAYSGWQIKKADDAYTYLVNNKASASLAMARVSRGLQRIGYGTLRVTAYDGNSPQARDALAELNKDYALTQQRLDEALTLMPSWSDRLTAYKARMLEIIEISKASTAKSAQNLNEAAMVENAAMDTRITSFGEDMTVWNRQIVDANRAESDALTVRANQTVLITISSLFVATISAIAASLMITSTGITGPLGQLRDLMEKLANGDFSVEVAGQDRKDEIGQMAKTVQIFKENGIRARELDAEAVRTREENERERAVVAREQEMVVSQLADGLARLSDGDLAFTLNEQFAAEYEKLRADFNGAMSKLKQTMQTVSGNTHGIRGGADEISQAADDLSRRTEQQAASLEETAAALDEITATVRTTAENANEARRVVAQASESAKHSGEVVGQAVEAMSKIEKSSQQISQIIGVIDEIAFQTNLLALNAGVEAARAGDAGRGFAVVASEVRALAQRSAEAAKEIKTLISASSTQVDQGVSLVAETGAALKGIVEQVAKINHLVADIAASAQEQATGLAQVNTAVNQMDQVTQQNAAMVEESTAASHSLAQETEQLSRLIGQFRTGEAPHEVNAPRRKPTHQTAAHRPVQATHTALKIGGRGGAALKPQHQPAEESWEEF